MRPDLDSDEPDIERLQRLLCQLPPPCPSLKVVKSVGEGTFSTVYLVKQQDYNSCRAKYAVKHLVPTASPDRILMEVDCLRMADGKENVLPLLFVHRHLGDVLLAMPFVECAKFSDVVRTMDHVEVRVYMRSLLKALAHIHSLGIIHRDIKPANFLYDRKRGRFGLVDFGLAQKSGAQPQDEKINVAKNPVCKRKLTSSDLADSMESPPSCAKRARRCSGRTALANRTAEEVNSAKPVTRRSTPTKKTTAEKPCNTYYDRRGSILSARKKTRSTSKLVSDSEGEEGEEKHVDDVNSRTPNKSVAAIMAMKEVRRSPRKHASSSIESSSTITAAVNVANKPGFSKLTISASAILMSDKNTPLSGQQQQLRQLHNYSGSAGSSTSMMRRQTSFTILDPASGIPSDGTPKLQASLTSRHSNMVMPHIHISVQPAAANTTAANTAAAAAAAAAATANTCGNSSVQSTTEQRTSAKIPASGRFTVPTPKNSACSCFGLPKVCSKCLGRRSQRAARAGTPGFRPPEVLLKCEHQTTAVDMWAAGVILLCILSRTYPFFRAPDDLTALAELVTLFGTRAVKEAASQYGKRFVCSENVPEVDLQTVCARLGSRRPPDEIQQSRVESSSLLNLATTQAVDLLAGLLKLSAHDRMSASEALQHPFFED